MSGIKRRRRGPRLTAPKKKKINPHAKGTPTEDEFQAMLPSGQFKIDDDSENQHHFKVDDE
ncbi:hypothetical protein HGRIS_012503 [Hohenbuehelia grisea]|uniref:Uncharacterized protein n=1 Tax=Hohenbuehelia grisea TaxID=104357 RepID=A0ABR3ISG8_9AGAR